MNLSDALAGETVILTGTDKNVRWLSDIGFIPGTPLTLLTRSGWGVTFRIRGIKYAMSLRLARLVYIRRPAK